MWAFFHNQILKQGSTWCTHHLNDTWTLDKVLLGIKDHVEGLIRAISPQNNLWVLENNKILWSKVQLSSFSKKSLRSEIKIFFFAKMDTLMPIRYIFWPKIGNFAASAYMHQSFIFKKNTETLKIICFFFKFCKYLPFTTRTIAKKLYIFKLFYIFCRPPNERNCFWPCQKKNKFCFIVFLHF